MKYSIVHRMGAPLRARNNAQRFGIMTAAGRRGADHDGRWPAIVAALAQLRFAGRYSVRIVDADCGTGDMLMMAVRQARMLGFTAIEGRGIDGVPSLVAAARSAARGLHDPAIGVTFEMTDMLTALRDEADFPADILFWHGKHADQDGVARAIAAAGRIVIDDSVAAHARAIEVAA